MREGESHPNQYYPATMGLIITKLKGNVYRILLMFAGKMG
jgi:hypothetical protein